MLELVDVHASYGKVRVLRGVNLKVEAGESVALLGRNGVGKTTTLRTIMGLLPASGGRIEFNGQDLRTVAAHRIAGRGIGYVPQGRGIFPMLTVFENLCIGLKGKPPEDRLKYVFERFPRLRERVDQAGGTLSGGEQQMLAIARCLVLEPRLLILDEPTEGIMPKLVNEIRHEIQRANQAGMSVLLVEQNVKTALKLCTRAFIMEKGVVVYDGTTAQLRAEPELIHRYLGLAL
ncbi:ABC transporter ATP-binding protein [Zeimonas arvi]|uniref:ABC transporter ATP-binding protein n=1 Tax=Zeimonas arvi TaxID=2498847 RepID=A0A5C8P4N0_9BURK|nr:ABC transporter ATP-binding protein [Zeimonas arvi]TXL68616.1 ABC transporter ATP-binding protein [Zeimonas arvi]